MEKSIVIDTNIVQALYMILNLEDGVQRLQEGNYTQDQINVLIKLSKNMHRFKFYVTTQIMKEVMLCEKKLPGIVEFTYKNCKIKIPKELDMPYKFVTPIRELQAEYLKKDIMLRDRTTKPQQAISEETKKGVKNYSDSLIVAEKNVLHGLPMFTLNEQHLITMNEAKKQSIPYRSRAILYKNKLYLKCAKIDDAKIKTNIGKETATTYKINQIFQAEYFTK